ncbi:MAG: Fur family transcriptional regulator [Acidimicrobiales bacterium]
MPVRQPAPTYPSPPETDAVMEMIRRSGGRASAARRAILEAMVAAGGHRSAEEIAVAVKANHPDVHEATVYRTLERFEALGVAYHTHLGHGPAQWHLSSSAHRHLTCQGCGKVIEVDLQLFRELQAALRDRFAFDADLRHFALDGYCSMCALNVSGVRHSLAPRRQRL